MVGGVIMGLTDLLALKSKKLAAQTEQIALLKANKMQEAYIVPTFINSWTSYADTGVAYRKDEFGRIFLKGSVGGGSNGSIAFVLPVGYRPTSTRYFTCYTGGSVIGKLTIMPDGSVTIGAYTVLISLDGISFTTD